MRDMTINTLTIDEIYALEGIFIGLEGLTESICKDYKVDSKELLKKLEAVVAELRERDRLNAIDMTVHGLVDTALETVKAIIAGLGGKHSKKVRIQETKKGVQIRYRNCAVCALVLDAEKNLTGIRFMGTTMETVNEATVREPAGLDTYSDEIAAQVAFIDWWWANASKKAAA